MRDALITEWSFWSDAFMRWSAGFKSEASPGLKMTCLRRQNVVFRVPLLETAWTRDQKRCMGRESAGKDGLDASNETFLQKTAQCSCTNSDLRYSPNPQRKTRAEKKGNERLKSLISNWIRNDLLKNTEATKRGWKPEFVVRKQKAKLCAVHENAQASVV